MYLLAADEFQLSSVPTEFWVWGFGTLLLSAGLGFVAGSSYARVSVDRAAKKARKELVSLYNLVLQTLESAQDACSVLEKFPQLSLSAEQTDQLDGRRHGLLETISRIVTQQRERIVQQKEKAAAARAKQEQSTLVWVQAPVDSSTGLPAREAFDANLAQLLEHGAIREIESGLLLVKLDKADQLRARFGASGVEGFLKKMATVIIRSIRDADIVCRFSPDEFGVLLPDIDDETGRRIAHAIRNLIRNYHFRLEDNGPEVLVTASFGYSRCRPHDHQGLALDRAVDALSKSAHRGRNQLHVHDGEAVMLCIGA